MVFSSLSSCARAFNAHSSSSLQPSPDSSGCHEGVCGGCVWCVWCVCVCGVCGVCVCGRICSKRIARNLAGENFHEILRELVFATATHPSATETHPFHTATRPFKMCKKT